MEDKYTFNTLFVLPFSHTKIGKRGKISTLDFYDIIDVKLNMPENEDRDGFIANLADDKQEIDIDFLREEFYPDEEDDYKLSNTLKFRNVKALPLENLKVNSKDKPESYDDILTSEEEQEQPEEKEEIQSDFEIDNNVLR